MKYFLRLNLLKQMLLKNILKKSFYHLERKRSH